MDKDYMISVFLDKKPSEVYQRVFKNKIWKTILDPI